TGRVVLGFEDGRVVCFDPGRGEVEQVVSGTDFYYSPVASVAADGDGEFLAVVRGHHTSARVLTAYGAEGGGRVAGEAMLTVGRVEGWLARFIPSGGGHLMGLWEGERLGWLEGAHLVPAGSVSTPSAADPSAVLLLPPLAGVRHVGLCVFAAGDMWHLPHGSAQHSGVRLDWTPAVPEGSSLRSPALSWFSPDPEHLELAGMTRDGVAYWSRLSREDRSF